MRWFLLVGLIACGDRKEAAPQAARDMQGFAALCNNQDMASCRRACELGHSNSCYAAGEHQRACSGGSGLGCRAAGQVELARRYLKVHCEQAHRDSCAGLAEMAARGEGGGKDPGEARYAQDRACSLGLSAACADAGLPGL